MDFRIKRSQQISTPIASKNASKNIGNDFKKLLDETIKTKDAIKFSGHAKERMAERGIRLYDQDMKLISQGMDKLSEKGASESLMLYKDMAFIASIENRTIITAMGNREMELVTNIDSAILIK